MPPKAFPWQALRADRPAARGNPLLFSLFSTCLPRPCAAPASGIGRLIRVAVLLQEKEEREVIPTIFPMDANVVHLTYWEQD
jgi:hypothetical protein